METKTRGRGRPPEEGIARSSQLTINIIPRLDERIRARADEEEVPLTELGRRALRHYLDNTRVRQRNGETRVVRYTEEYGGGGISSESDGDGW